MKRRIRRWSMEPRPHTGVLTTLNGSMVTAHSQGLSGLAASTTYNYRVRSKDAAGNQAVSGNFDVCDDGSTGHDRTGDFGSDLFRDVGDGSNDQLDDQ